MKESPAPTVSATFTDGAGKCASPAAFTPQGPWAPRVTTTMAGPSEPPSDSQRRAESSGSSPG